MRPNESTVFAFCVQLISEFLLDPYVLEETVVKDPIGNRIVGRRRALAIDGKNRRKAEHTNPPTSHTRLLFVSSIRKPPRDSYCVPTICTPISPSAHL